MVRLHFCILAVLPKQGRWVMVRPVEHFVALKAQIVGTGTSISASAVYSIKSPGETVVYSIVCCQYGVI